MMVEEIRKHLEEEWEVS